MCVCLIGFSVLGAVEVRGARCGAPGRGAMDAAITFLALGSSAPFQLTALWSPPSLHDASLVFIPLRAQRAGPARESAATPTCASEVRPVSVAWPPSRWPTFSTVAASSAPLSATRATRSCASGTGRLSRTPLAGQTTSSRSREPSAVHPSASLLTRLAVHRTAGDRMLAAGGLRGSGLTDS